MVNENQGESCSDYCAGDLKNAKVLVIGHDPRLQNSNALANKAFFGDYYFEAIPTREVNMPNMTSLRLYMVISVI